MKTLLMLFLVAILGLPVRAAVVGKAVEYKAGDTILKGWLAYDDAVSRKRPGVLVVHEWWGNNDYPRKRATMLAELGYVALAVDMYGGGQVARNPQEAGQLAGWVKQHPEVRQARFAAAENFLRAQPQVDPARIAAIGYCFGGTMVLEAARDGAALVGVVSFHGDLGTTTPAKKDTVKARVLVCHGASDQFVPAAEVQAFAKEMTAAGVKFEIKTYPDATHAFTNPASDAVGKQFNLPIRYNPAADQRSWADMKAFLKEVFAHP